MQDFKEEIEELDAKLEEEEEVAVEEEWKAWNKVAEGIYLTATQ